MRPSRWLAVAPWVVGAAWFGCGADQPPPGVEDLTLAEPSGYHEREGYVRLVPPAHLPSTSPQLDQVEIWVRLPEDATIAVHEDSQGRPTLEFPPGTVADRVEFRGLGDQRTIADIRGTTLKEGGNQDFHIYRPTSPKPGAPLFGLRWSRQDTNAHRSATERLVAKSAELAPIAEMPAQKRDRVLQGIRVRNRCVGCHLPSRADNATPREHGLVNRGTDHNGFVTPQTILWDEVPLESYGVHDRSWADPAIDPRCEEGATEPDERACANGSVPRGRLVWDSKDPGAVEHLRAVCGSRVWLLTSMTAEDRARWSDVVAPCKKIGIGG